MTNRITYTHFFDDFDSSLVDSVAYDESTGAAYVDLNDEVYRYDNVTLNDVKSLVNAPSVGRAFNGSFISKGFKQKFGPGKHLGNWSDIEYDERANNLHPNPSFIQSNGGTVITSDGRIETVATNSNPGGGKNLTYAANAVVDGKPVSEQRVSLKPEPVVEGRTDVVHIPLKTPAGVTELPKAEELEFTVHFESNGSKTYTVKAVSWQEAVAKLDEAAEILGVRAKVTGVFVHLV